MRFTEPFWSSSMAALGVRWCRHSAAQTQLVSVFVELEAADVIVGKELCAVKRCYEKMLVSLVPLST